MLKISKISETIEIRKKKNVRLFLPPMQLFTQGQW